MSLYIVRVPEVHIKMYEVEAESAAAALEAIMATDGEEVSFDYSHCLPVESWIVEKCDDSSAANVPCAQCGLYDQPLHIDYKCPRCSSVTKRGDA